LTGPEAELVYGIDAWLEQVFRLLEPWHEQRLEIESMRTTGDLVIVTLRWVATGRESQIEVDMPLTGVYTVTNPKIGRIEFFVDPKEALEAAGLSEWAMSRKRRSSPRRIGPQPRFGTK
jgi:hypothetical protein